MTWLDNIVSLYATHYDNIGRAATVGDIIFKESERDRDLIRHLRRIDPNMPVTEYKALCKPIKQQLQCFTPAALFKTKERNNVQEVSRSGIMQLDFDIDGIGEYDLHDLKRAIFELPFIGLSSLSCSGTGIFALALIAELNRLSEYAEHVFVVLQKYGVPPDESKGKKPENLRYVSIDDEKLVRTYPTPLRVKHFRTKSVPKIKVDHFPDRQPTGPQSGLVGFWLDQLSNAVPGERMTTIQRVSYRLGGLQKPELLEEIICEINSNPRFVSELPDFIRCAKDCFNSGMLKPFNA